MFSGKGPIPTCLFQWECLGAERCDAFLAALVMAEGCSEQSVELSWSQHLGGSSAGSCQPQLFLLFALALVPESGFPVL